MGRWGAIPDEGPVMGVTQRRMFLKRKRTREGKAGGQVFLFALRPSPRHLRLGSRVGVGGPR